MKIFSQTYYGNISFQKRLAAKANILSKDGKPEKVRIYHLDNTKDEKYLQNAVNNKNWENNFYLEEAAICFADDYKDIKYYTMEDAKHNLLYYCTVDENDEKENKLTCIETMPKQSSYSDKKRSFKYIGETMLAFLAKETANQDKEILYISSIAKRPKTEHFYFEQCKCLPVKTKDAVLQLSGINELVLLNEKHTSGKIKLIA